MLTWFRIKMAMWEAARAKALLAEASRCEREARMASYRSRTWWARAGPRAGPPQGVNR